MAAASMPKTLHTILGLTESTPHMELSQIELIYRAEGNANLVLALPQFEKVLRLPKMPKSSALSKASDPFLASLSPQTSNMEVLQRNEKTSKVITQEAHLAEAKPTAMTFVSHEIDTKASVSVSALSSRGNIKAYSFTEDLAMADYAAYMKIIQNFVGCEYILEPEICLIPSERDRNWINEHIRESRPAHRRDKEFFGQFGLLLPDATMQLPKALVAEGAKEAIKTTATTSTCTSTSTSSSSSPQTLLLIPAAASTSSISPRRSLKSEVKLSGEIYAIEIKPKQGWLLPISMDCWERMRSTKNSRSNINCNSSSCSSGSSNTNADIGRSSLGVGIVSDIFATKPIVIETKVKNETKAASAPQTIPKPLKIARTIEGDSATETGMNIIASRSSDGTVDTRCRYCMMQFLKLKTHKIKKVSKYCPINLFSGKPSKMQAAFDALLECPQNNLRVFRNGVLIYGDHEHSASLDDLRENVFQGIENLQFVKDLTVECLLRDYCKNNNNSNNTNTKTNNVNKLAKQFSESGAKHKGEATEEERSHNEFGKWNESKLSNDSNIVECTKFQFKGADEGVCGQPHPNATKLDSKTTITITTTTDEATSNVMRTGHTTMASKLPKEMNLCNEQIATATEDSETRLPVTLKRARETETTQMPLFQQQPSTMPVALIATTTTTNTNTTITTTTTTTTSVTMSMKEAKEHWRPQTTTKTQMSVSSMTTTKATMDTGVDTITTMSLSGGADIKQTSTSIVKTSTAADGACLLPRNCILDKILNLQLLVKDNLNSMLDSGYRSHEEKKKTYGALEALLQRRSNSVNLNDLEPKEKYLLGATALDCSIMLTFQEIDSSLGSIPQHPNIVYLPSAKRHYLTKVTLLDLDPKPDSHLCKYIKQTKDALECFVEAIK